MSTDSASHGRERAAARRASLGLHHLRNRTLPILVAIVALLVCYPLFDTPNEPTPIIVMILFGAVPLFGVAMLASRRWMVVVALAAIAANVGLLALHGPHTEMAIARWPGLLVLLFYSVATFTIARAVFFGPTVVDDRVYGGIAVYLMIGIIFAILHHRVGIEDPGAYFVADQSGPRGVQLNWADYLYYSFVCLTTVGFGDMVPRGAWARNLSVFEAAVGMLYPAVLLARLVNRSSSNGREVSR